MLMRVSEKPGGREGELEVPVKSPDFGSEKPCDQSAAMRTDGGLHLHRPAKGTPSSFEE